MDQHKGCPEVNLIERLIQGRLSDEESVVLEQHLLACESCQQQTRALNRSDTMVDAIRKQAVQLGEPVENPLLDSVIERLRDRSLLARLMSALEGTRISSESAESPSEDDLSDLIPVLRPAEAPDELGRLDGFRLLKLLGHGGMGAVFLAEDLRLKRRVALKLLRPEFAKKKDAAERFLREAQAAATVRHDNVVTIFQVGEDNGTPFMAQELLRGESLHDRLQREKALPIAEVLRIGRQIADGLAAAHAHGLLHRDIKPANVWLESSPVAPRQESRDGTKLVAPSNIAGATDAARELDNPLVERDSYVRVKILDFGLARLEQSDSQLTGSGMILGTPAYMSPEQASGEVVDARTDLFSLGVVLYRMATGEQPFKGKDTLSVLKSLAVDVPTPPQNLRADISSELSDFILRLLEKDRTRRPSSAAEVAGRMAALSRLCLETKAVRTAGRPRAAILQIALGFAAAVLLFGVIVVKIKTKEGKETEVTIDVPGEVDSATVSMRNEDSKAVMREPRVTTGPSPFDALDPAAIPAAERFDWQPKELVAVIGSHRQRLWGSAASVALSGDGSLCLAGGHYCQGMLVDVKNGKTLPSPIPPMERVGVSPDGTMLFWKQSDGKMGLMVRNGETWKPREMSLPKAVTGFQYHPWDATFSLDGRWLATSILHEVLDETPKYSTYVWDVSVDPPQQAVQLHGYKHPTFSPDGKQLAVIATQDGPYSLQVFDLGELPPKRHAVVPGMAFPREVAFALKPRHGFLASGKLVALDKAGTLAVWDVSTSDPKLVARRELMKEGYASLCPFPTGNDQLVLFNGATFATWRLDENSLNPEFTFPEQPWFGANIDDVAVSQDGRTMASSHLNGMVKLWDVTEGGLREKEPIRPQPVHGLRSIVLAPDGKHFVTHSEDDFQVWRLNGPACQRLDSSNSLRQMYGPIGFVNSTQFTTIGGLCYQWRIDGDRVASVGELSDQINPLANGPNGLILSVDSNKPTAHLSLWQADRLPGKQICSWEATPPGRMQFFSNSAHYAYFVSADGHRLVSADRAPGDAANPVIRVWQRSDEAAVPTEFATISLFGDQLHGLALSPDGQLLAVAAQGGLSLWKLGADKAERLWQKSDGTAQAVTFSPDGQQIASSANRTEGYGSGIVTIHNLQGERTHRWTFPNYPASIAFAPDGHHLLTANPNGTVYILRLN